MCIRDRDLTVDTNTLFVDASENTVVVGGTDASSWNANADELIVAGASAGGMTFYNPTQTNIFFADGTSGDDLTRGRIQYVHSDNSLRFGTDTSERVRINSSGNLFVGKTASDSNVVGVQAHGDGFGSFTRSGDKALIVNRKTNDGEILTIRRDGTTVGSLDTVGVSTSGRLVVKSTTFDGFLDRAGTTIAKWMSSSFTPGADNTFDLGRGAERWQDIYLSGGAYLGGTGTANKLDDYEEGTFTPTWTSNVTVSVASGNYGYYTKIGDEVTVHFGAVLNSSGGTPNYFSITNAPFQSNISSGKAVGAAREYGQTGYMHMAVIGDNSTTIQVKKYDSTAVANPYLACTLTYRTD